MQEVLRFALIEHERREMAVQRFIVTSQAKLIPLLDRLAQRSSEHRQSEQDSVPQANESNELLPSTSQIAELFQREITVSFRPEFRRLLQRLSWLVRYFTADVQGDNLTPRPDPLYDNRMIRKAALKLSRASRELSDEEEQVLLILNCWSFAAEGFGSQFFTYIKTDTECARFIEWAIKQVEQLLETSDIQTSLE